MPLQGLSPQIRSASQRPAPRGPRPSSATVRGALELAAEPLHGGVVRRAGAQAARVELPSRSAPGPLKGRTRRVLPDRQIAPDQRAGGRASQPAVAQPGGVSARRWDTESEGSGYDTTARPANDTAAPSSARPRVGAPAHRLPARAG